MTQCAIALLFAVLPSCSQPTKSPATTQPQIRTASNGDTVRLAVGESVRLGTSGTVVGFERVLSDSRCRPDVQCVWEGSVRVRLMLSEHDRSTSFVELDSSMQPRSVNVGAYRIELLREIEPPPGSAGTYVIRLVLSPA
jgi:hypothetical protein